MIRRLILTLLAGFLIVETTPAQTSAPKFHWQAGQVLLYRVEQVTSAAEVVGDNKAQTRTKLNLTKKWQVKSVDKAGIATLEMSLTLLRIENTRPDGEPLIFDSANPDKSNPEMTKDLSKYVDKPLAALRIDPQGKVVEVKESKFGPASRFENELPFVLTLPDSGLKEGLTWERAYTVTLAPPQGAGEKYDATQKYTCKSFAADAATMTMITGIKNLPEALLDQIPLLQLQPQGEIVFDLKKGLMRSARLTIDKEIKGHQGEGSSYRFQSVYTEEYAAEK
jgi:hypothetical protein